MRTRKINVIHIVAAMVLSVAFLFVGCGTGATGEVQAELDIAKQEISDNKDLVKEDDVKEENPDEATANGNKEENPNKATANENKEENPNKAVANGNKEENSDKAIADGNKEETPDKAIANGNKEETPNKAIANGNEEETPNKAKANGNKEETLDKAKANGNKEETPNKDMANGNKEETPNKNIANKNEVTGNQEAPSGKTGIYGYVLAEYSDMVQNDFYAALRDSDSYESSFGEDIGLEIRTHERDVYYAFYDIDGNGVMELVIASEENGVGVSNPRFSPWNYDLYGYDGTKVVHIFPEMEFGYRTNFKLYGNGVIEVFYSGSAAESGVDFYRIGNDGFTPELVDSFATVAHLEGDEPVFAYSRNGNEITEEEYKANIQSYEVILSKALDWVQIQ